MIVPTKFNSTDFSTTFEEYEPMFVDELEDMIISKLMEDKSVTIPGTDNEILEFAGKTNFKIMLKRPNKNVWSVPLQDIKDHIREVLREGELAPVIQKTAGKGHTLELPILMLLHTLANEEYVNRSFVGNNIVHKTLGEGKVIRISSSGNVEIKFEERVAMLKPNFIQLKLA